MLERRKQWCPRRLRILTRLAVSLVKEAVADNGIGELIFGMSTGPGVEIGKPFIQVSADASRAGVHYSLTRGLLLLAHVEISRRSGGRLEGEGLRASILLYDSRGGAQVGSLPLRS